MKRHRAGGETYILTGRGKARIVEGVIDGVGGGSEKGTEDYSTGSLRLFTHRFAHLMRRAFKKGNLEIRRSVKKDKRKDWDRAMDIKRSVAGKKEGRLVVQGGAGQIREGEKGDNKAD